MSLNIDVNAVTLTLKIEQCVGTNSLQIFLAYHVL